MRLTAEPAAGLVDEAVRIRVSEGRSGGRVLLRGRMIDHEGHTWESWAEYRLDQNGALDLAEAAPISGTYAGADPAGLCWSMVPLDTAAASDHFPTSEMTPVRLRFTAEGGEETAAAVEVERGWIGTGVSREPVERDGVKGFLWVPAGPAPFRPVLSFGGSDGGVHEESAALLASRGFLTLALPYFRFPGLPPDLVRIPLEYFGRAIHLLAHDPRADGGGVGVVGRSRGGELSLLLAATFAEVDAAVAYVPSGIVHSGIPASSESWQSDVPSWTWQGKPVPYLAHVAAGPSAASLPSPARLTPLYCADLSNWAGAQAAAIPVEKSSARLLLISGIDDAMWPSSLFSELVLGRLQAHGGGPRVRHVAYPAAGHRFNFPTMPGTVTASVHPADGRLYEYGGTPEGNSRAGLAAHLETVAWLRRQAD
jgi:dienelactone hydrolase